MDNVILVCSRKKSSRIPNKAFYKICGVETIKHIENRLEGIGIETYFLVPPSEIEEYKSILKGNVCSGNADSPLHRMADFVRGSSYRYVIRITGDDILIDKQTIKDMLSECERGNYGYAFSPEIIEGAGVEIISVENILKAAETRKEPTEFVSYFVKGKCAPNNKVLVFKPRAAICRPYRLTLDYPLDAVVVETVLRELGPQASCDKIVKFLDHRPEILELNRLPELTIYTCAYNADKYIYETIQSVTEAARDLSYEYIIIDDCSTDGTLTEISKAAALNRRIKIYTNEKNIGLASSSNIALSRARGQYIMRVDADDLLMGIEFESAIAEMSIMLDRGYDAIYPGYMEINSTGKFISGKIISPKINHHAGCCLMNKKTINEIRFREGLRHWDSLELYTKLKDNSMIGYYDYPTWKYRRHKDCMSKNDLAKRAKIKAEINKGLIRVKK